ncbi:MAG: cyclopropane fatty acyl phospholipid synthase [Desulfarculus sp.]|nr:cyclopropane fatty acyl phospholipid synthase [Desulfarculus sp.]
MPRQASLESLARRTLAEAQVEIDGDRPWDIQVHDQRWYYRVLTGGSLALGESYMDGWWDCQALDQFFHRLLRARLDEKIRLSPGQAWAWLVARLSNRQSRSRADQVAKAHYNLGNDLFAAMLDQDLNYSCAWWEDGCADLDQAQASKLRLICHKLMLKPGMRLLDIGCGWGGLARFAAQEYGARVVGVTVSQPQAELASQRCQGLPVEIRLQDYRAVEGRFDRVVSVGMFEHVGYKNYRTFMRTVVNCLEEDGLLLLHTIGRNDSSVQADPWISTYIFPNGMLPSVRQIAQACEGLLVLEDWHSFGSHYDRTLMAWHHNFQRAWPRLKDRYDERFRRMWSYYLLSCAGAFRARSIQLWQVVLSPRGLEGGYRRWRQPAPTIA